MQILEEELWWREADGAGQVKTNSVTTRLSMNMLESVSERAVFLCKSLKWLIALRKVFRCCFLCDSWGACGRELGEWESSVPAGAVLAPLYSRQGQPAREISVSSYLIYNDKMQKGQ